MLKNQMHADFLKLRKTSFFILHLGIPLLGILLFFVYKLATPYEADPFTVNYYQVLTLIYPLIATWMCTIVTDQEVEAGGGFYMLMTISRSKTLLSKLIFLVFMGLGACLLAGVGFKLLLGITSIDSRMPLMKSIELILLVWICSFFQYFLHIWLGLRFGRNVNFAVGTVELLLGALLLTGLGETIWFFFPCAWGMRILPIAANGRMLPKLFFIAAVIETLGMLIFLFWQFKRWEGRKNEE